MKQKHPATTEHNYAKKILALGLTLRPGQLVETDVAHDPWCDMLNGRGFCNCDPTVAVRPIHGSKN